MYGSWDGGRWDKVCGMRWCDVVWVGECGTGWDLWYVDRHASFPTVQYISSREIIKLDGLHIGGECLGCEWYFYGDFSHDGGETDGQYMTYVQVVRHAFVACGALTCMRKWAAG